MVADPFAMARFSAENQDPFAISRYVASAASHTAPSYANVQSWGGSKFPGGFGITNVNVPNYWDLRARSAQLFTENLYARGLLRRLVTNEINIGLTVESEPNFDLLDSLDEEQAAEWASDVESRHEIWATNPKLCDYEGRRTFAQIQAEVSLEAKIEGDVLIVLRHNKQLGVPQIQTIRGGRVRTPLKLTSETAKVVDGVELDERGRHVAFHVLKKKTSLLEDEDSIRIPAFGPRSKRRLAWLVYGSDKRADQVRGEPMLSIVLQSLRELDRYRDSEQRAAVVNSLVAMFVMKNSDRPGTRPFTGGAVRNVTEAVTGPGNEARTFQAAEQWPGMVIEELALGEEPKSFDTKRPNVNYAAFEEAVIQAVAWANEVPPEILKLAFSNNYSASKAAINEFKAYIQRVRADFASNFCQPIFTDWLVSETLRDRIDAPGFLEAFRDPLRFNEFGAWTRAQWGGPVKPSVELKKDVDAYNAAIEADLITMDRASKDLFGVRSDKVLARRKKEKAAVKEMNDELGITPEPVIPEPGAAPAPADVTEAMEERILELVRDEIEREESLSA